MHVEVRLLIFVFLLICTLYIGFVELCATILKIIRALFANYFCHFLPKTFLGFVLHIAEYKIDLFYVYGIDEIAYRHLQKLRTFCIPWPDRLH